jgi:hypothetical protein
MGGETRTLALFLGLAPELRRRVWRFSLPITRLLFLEADPMRSIPHNDRWYNCLRLANNLELLPMICACRESLSIVRETVPDMFLFSELFLTTVQQRTSS